MKCFNHHDQDAVAICKSCGKGLCPSCSVEVTNGVACKGACEARVNILNQMVDNNKKILSTSNKRLKTSSYISIILGLLFVVFGTAFYPIELLFMVTFQLMGLVFIITGLLQLRKAALYPTMQTPPKE